MHGGRGSLESPGASPGGNRWHDFARQPPCGLSKDRVVGVHDGDDGVVEAAPRAHQGVFQMEKPVAEPGAVVAGRVAGQAHDRIPQFGEAFRQILMWAAASRAPVRASGRNPPGSGRAPGMVSNSPAVERGVRVSNIGFLRGLQDSMAAMPGELPLAHRLDHPSCPALGLYVLWGSMGGFIASGGHGAGGDGGPGIVDQGRCGR